MMMTAPRTNNKLDIKIVGKVLNELVLNCDKRHRLIVGGRGKGASWSIARICLFEGMQRQTFIPCVREVQKTIKYSVKRLLDQQISDLNLKSFYRSTDNEIKGKNGTIFAFFGLQEYNSDNIKSLEGADLCWTAEAQNLSRRSVNILRPTIRKNNSVMWWDFNPRYETDPVWIDYIVNNDPNAKVLWLNWRDNPWFTQALYKEMQADYTRDETEAKHIWEGELRDQGERYVCPSNLVLLAINNTIHNAQGEIVVGADIAHQGGDEIVFYKRMGMKVIDSYYKRNMRKSSILKDLVAFAGDTSVIINIDNGHIGAAVADDLEDLDFIVNRINFGGKPYDDAHYEDCVTEMYFHFRDIAPHIDIPNDEEMYKQLIQRKWRFINGRRGYEVMKIESKDEFKEHATNINPSPDRADAIVMCYYDSVGIEGSMETLSHNIFA